MDEFQTDSRHIEELLARARDGDREASEELFAACRGYLRRLVELRLDRQVRARVDASDVVQEAQLEAVRRFGEYLKQPSMPFRLWLRQIAYDWLLKMHRHHADTARRAVGREIPLPEESSVLLARRLLGGGSTPSQQINRRELARRLREAIGQLSDADREILLMRHFEGLSNQEVCQLLRLDPGTVSKRHGRAMLRLHRILFESGLTESQL